MAAGSWGRIFLEHVARNINPFLWEMLCKDDSSKCLGNIVLVETRCWSDQVSEQLLFLSHICKEATFLRLSPSLLPHYHLSFVHHIHHQEQEHPGDTLVSAHGANKDLEEEASGLAWDPDRLKLCHWPEQQQSVIGFWNGRHLCFSI